MKTLLCWYNMIMEDHSWIVRTINKYFSKCKLKKEVRRFYRDFTKPQENEIIWTNHAQYRMIDHYEYFKLFDKVIYIIRKPIEAMKSIYYWIQKEFDTDFLMKWLKRHVLLYNLHVECNKKGSIIMPYEYLLNPEGFLRFMSLFINNINEDIFYKYFTLPKKLKTYTFPKEAENLINQLWKEGYL